MQVTIIFDHHSNNPLIEQAYEALLANPPKMGGLKFNGIEFRLNQNGLCCLSGGTMLSLPTNLASLPIIKVILQAEHINQWPAEGVYTHQIDGATIARGLVESINWQD